MTENNMNVNMRFVVDKQSQKEAQAAIKQTEYLTGGIAKQAQNATKESQRWGAVVKQIAKDLGTSAEVVAKQWAGMSSVGQRTTQQLMQDVKAFEQMEVASTDTAKSVERIEKSVTKIGRQSRYGMIGMAGFALSMAGSRLSGVGRQGLSPIGQYTSAFGETEVASGQWLQTQERLEGVMVRIGRIMTEELLPVFEQLTDLAEKAAEFAEQHPEVVGAAGKIFGGAVVGGGALAAIGNILASVGALKYLTTISGAGGTAAAGAGGSMLIPGIGLAAATGAGLLSVYGERNRERSDLSKALPYLFRPEAAVKESSISRTAQAQEFNDEQLSSYLEFSEKNMEKQVEYHKKRTEMINSFNQSMIEMEREYQSNRQRYISDFYANEKKIQADYYYDRKQLAAKYNIDIQRMEEDHQRKIRKLTEEHADRMEDLISKRDALGIVREMRDYGRSVRDADEEYRREAARRNQDFARKLADMAAQFQIERQRRLEQFQIDLKEADEQYNLKRQKARENHRKELQELDEKYREEINKRREAFIKQLQDTAEFLSQERELRQQFTEAMLADLRSMIAQSTTSTGTYPGYKYPSRALGGYVSGGIYQMHDNEFVMNPQTTRAAEQLARGKLNQASLLQMLSGGGVTYNDHRRIDGRILPEDRRAIQRETQDILKGLFA